MDKILARCKWVGQLFAKKLSCFIIQFPEHRDSIQSVGQLLINILDVEETKVTKSFTIRPNYDEEMDACKCAWQKFTMIAILIGSFNVWYLLYHIIFAVIQRHRDLPDILAERLSEPVKELKQLVRSAVHIHYSSQVILILYLDFISPLCYTAADPVILLHSVIWEDNSQTWFIFRIASSSECFVKKVQAIHWCTNELLMKISLGLIIKFREFAKTTSLSPLVCSCQNESENMVWGALRVGTIPRFR